MHACLHIVLLTERVRVTTLFLLSSLLELWASILGGLSTFDCRHISFSSIWFCHCCNSFWPSRTSWSITCWCCSTVIKSFSGEINEFCMVICGGIGRTLFVWVSPLNPFSLSSLLKLKSLKFWSLLVCLLGVTVTSCKPILKGWMAF